MSRVGIDLDGVVYDFAAGLLAAMRIFGMDTRPCSPPTRWEFYLDWGLTLEEFKAVCHAGVDRGIIFTHGDPFKGARDALVSLRNAGHTLHIVTDRNWGTQGRAEAATRAYLDAHDLPFDSLTFSADKTVARVDFMVDDKPGNYDALRLAGVRTWLLTRPWNADHPAFYRATSLAHFAQIVNTHA